MKTVNANHAQLDVQNVIAPLPVLNVIILTNYSLKIPQPLVENVSQVKMDVLNVIPIS